MERIDLETRSDGYFALFPERLLPRGLRAGISLRAAGDMDPAKEDVLGNRGRLFRLLGVDPDRVLRVHQVHSRIVAAAESPSMGTGAWPEADGITAGSGRAVLAVTVGDCLPVYLADGRTGAFALVHSGWKGTGIAVEAIARMEERYGSRPEDLTAVLGPCIGPCCYGVPEDRWRSFLDAYGPRAALQAADGKRRIDLRGANAVLLERAGVRRIFAVDGCTCCDAAFGSFRREGPSFTRMLSLLGGF